MKRRKCSIGSLSADPCSHTAAFYAERWGHNDDLHLCEEHAIECMTDGWKVTGETGVLAWDLETG